MPESADGIPRYARSKFLDLLFRASESFGMTRNALLRRAGLRRLSDDCPPGYSPFDQAVALYDAATHVLGHSGLVPRMVELLPTPDNLGVPGYLLLTAPTVGSAFQCLQQVYHTQTRRGSWHVRLSGERCILSWHDRKVTTGLHACNEANVLHFVEVMLPRIVGNDVPVTSVSFAHPQLGTCFEKRFNYPITFEASETAVVLPREFLDAHPRLAHPSMHEFFHRALGGELSSVGHATFPDRIRERIQEHLGHDSVSASLLARELGTSERTLRRRLAEANSSVSQELDGARRRKAAYLLSSTNESITAVALELGFADASVLSRACRRWFGEPPMAVRERMKAP